MDFANKTAATTAGWDKTSTPGVKADLLLLKKKQVDDKLILAYKLHITGLPRNLLYKLVTWQTSARLPNVMNGVSIAEDGFAICAGETPEQCKFEGKERQISLIFSGIKKAEIIRVGLMSLDNKYRAMTSLVPDPIVATDQGCSLEAVRLAPNFLLALVRAKGFKPNEDLMLTSNSAGEVITLTGKTDADGEYFTSLLPGVKGKAEGTVQFQAKGSGCAPRVLFSWGPLEQ